MTKVGSCGVCQQRVSLPTSVSQKYGPSGPRVGVPLSVLAVKVRSPCTIPSEKRKETNSSKRLVVTCTKRKTYRVTGEKRGESLTVVRKVYTKNHTSFREVNGTYVGICDKLGN